MKVVFDEHFFDEIVHFHLNFDESVLNLFLGSIIFGSIILGSIILVMAD